MKFKKKQTIMKSFFKQFCNHFSVIRGSNVDVYKWVIIFVLLRWPCPDSRTSSQHESLHSVQPGFIWISTIVFGANRESGKRPNLILSKSQQEPLQSMQPGFLVTTVTISLSFNLLFNVNWQQLLWCAHVHCFKWQQLLWCAHVHWFFGIRRTVTWYTN